MKYVYIVTYDYDYEGSSVEGVYATKKLAEKHPSSRFGRKEIHRARVFKRVKQHQGIQE